MSCAQGRHWAPHQASCWYSRPLHTGNRAKDVSRLLLLLKNLWIKRQRKVTFWKRGVFKQCFPGIHHRIYWGTSMKTKSFLLSSQLRAGVFSHHRLQLDTKQWQRSTTLSRARNWSCSVWKSSLPKIPALFTADRHSVEKPDRQREFFPEISLHFSLSRNLVSRKHLNQISRTVQHFLK